MKKFWRMLLSGALLTAAVTYFVKDRPKRRRTWNYLQASKNESDESIL